MDFKDRVALVTGAAVGTGRAAALELARRGCHVAVNYSRSAAEADETADGVRKLGVRTIAVQADVADDTAVRAMVERTIREFGRLDVLINNAGTTEFVAHGDLEAVTDAVWERILSVNLKGPFHAVRAATPALREARGAIVNISSIAGVYAVGSSIPYCASKAALNNMTVALARALAPEVRVNAVAPGYIDTRWWKERPGYEAVKQYAAERTLLQRVAQAEDVAKVAVDLAESDMLTGQVLVLDGGMGIVR